MVAPPFYNANYGKYNICYTFRALSIFITHYVTFHYGIEVYTMWLTW